jgi:hypothetical protein
MKGYEYAKEHGMTSAEVKEKFGLKSHLSVVPDMPEKPVALPVEPTLAEKPTIEPKKPKKCPVSDDELFLSLRCLGSKSKYWEFRDNVNWKKAVYGN